MSFRGGDRFRGGGGPNRGFGGRGGPPYRGRGGGSFDHQQQSSNSFSGNYGPSPSRNNGNQFNNASPFHGSNDGGPPQRGGRGGNEFGSARGGNRVDFRGGRGGFGGSRGRGENFAQRGGGDFGGNGGRVDNFTRRGRSDFGSNRGRGENFVPRGRGDDSSDNFNERGRGGSRGGRGGPGGGDNSSHFTPPQSNERDGRDDFFREGGRGRGGADFMTRGRGRDSEFGNTSFKCGRARGDFRGGREHFDEFGRGGRGGISRGGDRHMGEADFHADTNEDMSMRGRGSFRRGRGDFERGNFRGGRFATGHMQRGRSHSSGAEDSIEQDRFIHHQKQLIEFDGRGGPSNQFNGDEYHQMAPVNDNDPSSFGNMSPFQDNNNGDSTRGGPVSAGTEGGFKYNTSFGGSGNNEHSEGSFRRDDDAHPGLFGSDRPNDRGFCGAFRGLDPGFRSGVGGHRGGRGRGGSFNGNDGPPPMFHGSFSQGGRSNADFNQAQPNSSTGHHMNECQHIFKNPPPFTASMNQNENPPPSSNNFNSISQSKPPLFVSAPPTAGNLLNLPPPSSTVRPMQMCVLPNNKNNVFPMDPDDGSSVVQNVERPPAFNNFKPNFGNDSVGTAPLSSTRNDHNVRRTLQTETEMNCSRQRHHREERDRRDYRERDDSRGSSSKRNTGDRHSNRDDNRDQRQHHNRRSERSRSPVALTSRSSNRKFESSHHERKVAGRSYNSSEKDKISKSSIIDDDEPSYDKSLQLLSWYDSDLHLKITKSDFCSVTTTSYKGFALMWGGVRGTYGATRGRVCYELRIDKLDGDGDVEKNAALQTELKDEVHPFAIRVGWSVGVDSVDLQLGESPLSFGYGSTGKSSVNNRFVDYGPPFGVGDIVATYLDMNVDPHTIIYTLNGRPLGVCHKVSSREVASRPVFPHIVTKNYNFTVNFGQMGAPMSLLLPGFTPIGQFDLSDGLVAGPQPPVSRHRSEVIMMIGLPGAGKTHWCHDYRLANPGKNYNIIGTNSILDKMKVSGLSRKRNYHGRWDALISKCTECFNTILAIAKTRRRNFILDQTNVFPSARVRKMADFEGFRCRAVVVVPDDNEYRRRVAERERAEGKDVPDNAVDNMKANFVLPEIDEYFKTFSSIAYVDLGPVDALQVVKNYNKRGKMTRSVSDFVAQQKVNRRSLYSAEYEHACFGFTVPLHQRYQLLEDISPPDKKASVVFIPSALQDKTTISVGGAPTGGSSRSGGDKRKRDESSRKSRSRSRDRRTTGAASPTTARSSRRSRSRDRRRSSSYDRNHRRSSKRNGSKSPPPSSSDRCLGSSRRRSDRDASPLPKRASPIHESNRSTDMANPWIGGNATSDPQSINPSPFQRNGVVPQFLGSSHTINTFPDSQIMPAAPVALPAPAPSNLALMQAAQHLLSQFSSTTAGGVVPDSVVTTGPSLAGMSAFVAATAQQGGGGATGAPRVVGNASHQQQVHGNFQQGGPKATTPQFQRDQNIQRQQRMGYSNGSVQQHQTQPDLTTAGDSQMHPHSAPQMTNQFQQHQHARPPIVTANGHQLLQQNALVAATPQSSNSSKQRQTSAAAIAISNNEWPGTEPPPLGCSSDGCSIIDPSSQPVLNQPLSWQNNGGSGSSCSNSGSGSALQQGVQNSASTNGAPSGSGGGGGGPDYKALLQYLQFYQQQMEPNKQQPSQQPST